MLVGVLPFTATNSHSNDMTASDSALPREEPPMFRFTIRDVLWLTVVVAMSCRLATLIGWDGLSTYVVAMSGTGAGIGLWRFLSLPR